eukprot:440995-Rhodomonas_salina.1
MSVQSCSTSLSVHSYFLGLRRMSKMYSRSPLKYLLSGYSIRSSSFCRDPALACTAEDPCPITEATRLCPIQTISRPFKRRRWSPMGA